MTTNYLQAHHVIRLEDGGLDELDNTIALCRLCHREWHHYGEHVLTIDEFTTTPCARFLIALMGCEDAEDLTLADVQSLWISDVMQTLGLMTSESGALVTVEAASTVAAARAFEGIQGAAFKGFCHPVTGEYRR